MNSAGAVSLGAGGAGGAGVDGGYLPALEASGVPIEEVAGSFNGSGTIAGDVVSTQQNGDIAASSNGSRASAGGVNSTHQNGGIPGNIVEPNQSHPSGDDAKIDHVRRGNTPVKQVPEPSSLLLVAIGIVGFRATRKRMNQRQR
jgi:hypothetical protein